MSRFNIPSIAVALTALALSSPVLAAAETPIESILENIKGHWEANDQSKKGRIVKFFSLNRTPSFEDEVEPGVMLSGTLQQDDTGADVKLQYVNGFQCRYKLSYAAGHADGDTVTFRLVSSSDANDIKRFRCFEGRLDRIQRKGN